MCFEIITKYLDGQSGPGVFSRGVGCSTHDRWMFFGPGLCSSSLLFSSLELSDAKACEPEIRALLRPASHFCEVVRPVVCPLLFAAKRGGDNRNGIQDFCLKMVQVKAIIQP